MNHRLTTRTASTGYVKDAEKTDGGELVDSYECQPITAQSEFLFSKRFYEQKTRRDQCKNDVIAYHVRMSFKPGEVTAEKALELGYELALRWTKHRHQFIVAAHTNTNNPHVHIIYEYAILDAEKRKLYSGYKAAREEMITLQMAKQNVDIILGEPRQTEKSQRHEATR